MKNICTLLLVSSLFILLTGCSPEVYSALYAFNDAVMNSMNAQSSTESDAGEEQQSYTTAYENTTGMIPTQYQPAHSGSGMMRRPFYRRYHMPQRHGMGMPSPFHRPHHVHPGFMRRGIGAGIFRPGMHRRHSMTRHIPNRFGRFRI